MRDLNESSNTDRLADLEQRHLPHAPKIKQRGRGRPKRDKVKCQRALGSELEPWAARYDAGKDLSKQSQYQAAKRNHQRYAKRARDEHWPAMKLPRLRALS